MALKVPSIALSSGLTLTNAFVVVGELNVSNNASSNERLEVVEAPGGDGAAVNQKYKVVSTIHGGKNGTYSASIFMDQAAFDDGRPPVESFKEGRNTKFFSVDLLDAKYVGVTPREAAYLHLMEQESFLAATEVESLAI
jgi:hypothetical protein